MVTRPEEEPQAALWLRSGLAWGGGRLDGLWGPSAAASKSCRVPLWDKEKSWDTLQKFWMRINLSQTTLRHPAGPLHRRTTALRSWPGRKRPGLPRRRTLDSGTSGWYRRGFSNGLLPQVKSQLWSKAVKVTCSEVASLSKGVFWCIALLPQT